MPDRFSGALCRAGFFANHDVTIIDRLLTLAHHAPSVPLKRHGLAVRSERHHPLQYSPIYQGIPFPLQPSLNNDVFRPMAY